jgi:hypothetical protein
MADIAVLTSAVAAALTMIWTFAASRALGAKSDPETTVCSKADLC